MDELERQLRKDAEAIDVNVSPALETRIAASLQAVRTPASGSPASRRNEFRWWIFSTLTGAAAMLLVLVVVNRPDPTGVPTGDSTVADVADPVSPGTVRAIDELPLLRPLDVQTADFADPLSRELEAFKSDLQKARSELEDDLRFTF